jgi:hypothetical protein
LPSESYLDLGNRAAFENAFGEDGGDDAAPMLLHPDFAARVWQRDACAEMVLGGPVLAQVRRRLLLQAGWLGYAMNDDPDLRLKVGQHLASPDRIGSSYRFVLPAGARTARLVSRLHAPSAVSTDRADIGLLGVPVTELLLDRRALDLADCRLGEGWLEPFGPDGCRWTDGDARIAVAGMRELIVRLGAPGQYWRPAAQVA